MLVNKSDELWKKQDINREELLLMYEAFVMISNEIKDSKKIDEFYNFLLSSSIKEWNMNEITQILNSPELFLKSLGIIQDQDKSKQLSLESSFAKLKYILNLGNKY